MAFRKKTADSVPNPLASLLDALVPLSAEQFNKLFEAASQARKLKAEMDTLRAGLG